MARGASLASLQQLYERDYPRFLRLASSITGDRSAAQDAVQEAFTALIRSRSGYRGEGTVFAWAATAVSRHALRLRRSALVLPLDDDPDDQLPVEPSPFDDAQSVRKCLARLPDRQRLVLFLRYFGDLDYQAIAELLDVSVGTVSSTIHDAQAALRPLLEEVLHERSVG